MFSFKASSYFVVKLLVYIYYSLVFSSQSRANIISFPCHNWSSTWRKTWKLLFIDPSILCCATIAFVIASASAELEFPNRLLAAGKAVFALPISGWTNLTNVTSCSLLDTSKNSSAKSPKHLAFNISCTNCAFKTLPMRRNISLTEPAERCLKYLISSRPTFWRSSRRLVNFFLEISSFAIRYIVSNAL